MCPDEEGRRIPITVYFLFAYGISWLLWVPAVILGRQFPDQPFVQVLILLGTFGPLASALWIKGLESGTEGARQLMAAGLRWRMGRLVFAVSLLAPILIAAASYQLAGGARASLDATHFLAIFVVYFFVGGSFAEEFGWRGVAWPRLRQKHGRALAAILLGSLWAAWHLPLFWLPGTTQAVTPFWLFTVSCIGMSALTGWAYDRSGGSILSALLFHTAWNASTVLFPPFVNASNVDPTAPPTAALFVLAGLVVQFAARPSERGMLGG